MICSAILLLFEDKYRSLVGRDSSVGIATRYGLDVPEIESRWGRDFPHTSRPAVFRTQPPVQWYRVIPGVKAAREWRWPPTTSSKGKAVPLQTRRGPEGSRKLRFPDFMTTAQHGGKVVSLTHRLPLPPGDTHGINFCQRLCRPQGHSAIGRILCQWKFHWHQLGSNQRPSDL